MRGLTSLSMSQDTYAVSVTDPRDESSFLSMTAPVITIDRVDGVFVITVVDADVLAPHWAMSPHTPGHRFDAPPSPSSPTSQLSQPVRQLIREV